MKTTCRPIYLVTLNCHSIKTNFLHSQRWSQYRGFCCTWCPRVAAVLSPVTRLKLGQQCWLLALVCQTLYQLGNRTLQPGRLSIGKFIRYMYFNKLTTRRKIVLIDHWWNKLANKKTSLRSSVFFKMVSRQTVNRHIFAHTLWFCIIFYIIPDCQILDLYYNVCSPKTIHFIFYRKEQAVITANLKFLTSKLAKEVSKRTSEAPTRLLIQLIRHWSIPSSTETAKQGTDDKRQVTLGYDTNDLL